MAAPPASRPPARPRTQYTRIPYTRIPYPVHEVGRSVDLISLWNTRFFSLTRRRVTGAGLRAQPWRAARTTTTSFSRSSSLETRALASPICSPSSRATSSTSTQRRRCAADHRCSRFSQSRQRSAVAGGAAGARPAGSGGGADGQRACRREAGVGAALAVRCLSGGRARHAPRRGETDGQRRPQGRRRVGPPAVVCSASDPFACPHLV